MSMPDISLVPVIARFFGVTTDELFGMDGSSHLGEKEEYERAYRLMRQNGDIQGAYVCMVEATKRFPRDMHFCTNLAEIMDLFEGGTEEQIAIYTKNNFSRKIFTLCKRVIEESKDNLDRNIAQRLLCNCYAKSGNLVEAVKVAEGMSDVMHSKEVLLGDIYVGKEKQKQLQKNVLVMVVYIADTLVKTALQKEYGLAGELSIDDKISYVTAANGMYQMLVPDANYLGFHRNLCWNYRRLAELYLLKGDKEQAFLCLLEAEKSAVAFDDLDKEATCKYSSPFLSELEYCPETNDKCWIGTERDMLAYRLDEMKSQFEGHEGYELMKKRLGKTSIQL